MNTKTKKDEDEDEDEDIIYENSWSAYKQHTHTAGQLRSEIEAARAGVEEEGKIKGVRKSKSKIRKE
jgi:hypothetical protein